MTPDELEKLRDEFAAAQTLNKRFENYPGKDVCDLYKYGFDSCRAILEKEIARLKAELERK